MKAEIAGVCTVADAKLALEADYASTRINHSVSYGDGHRKHTNMVESCFKSPAPNWPSVSTFTLRTSTSTSTPTMRLGLKITVAGQMAAMLMPCLAAHSDILCRVFGRGIGNAPPKCHEVSPFVRQEMPRPYTLYMDESGNRHPDKKADATREGRDWFGFGGYLVRGEDNDAVRKLVAEFSYEWKLRQPLHITDMLSESKGFAWLGRKDQATREAFWDGWRHVLCSAPVIGIGCVIDRPGYVARGYLEKHKDKWLLCRSAFDITVERAAKIARLEGRKLHVVFEQDAAVNETVTGYFHNLKENGLGFDGKNSEKYKPLSQVEFAETLGRIQHKPKSHTMLQVADSFIYAMARHGYDKKFWIHRSLRDRKRLADFALDAEHLPQLGIKYYCFD